MSKTKEAAATARRDFLKLAGLGAAGGAVAYAAGAGKANAAQAGASGGGYRETEHVKKVYELSRF